MIRFRFREDEKRYLLLLGEIYRMLATHLSPPEMSMALRNFGKLQDMLMLEGVRQGVGAAAVSNLAKRIGDGDLEHLKAFQLHAHVYGSTDTPLSRAEAEWLEKLGFEGPAFEQALGAWLDPEAMRFAPATESAAMAALEEAREAFADAPPPIERVRDAWPEPNTGPDPEPLPPPPRSDREDGSAEEHPAMLDRTRDVLIELKKQGFAPKDWSELLMKLHLAMQVDAGFLDLQLSTPMGMTVLAQAGYTDLHPGAQFDLMQVQQQIEAQEQPELPEAELTVCGHHHHMYDQTGHCRSCKTYDVNYDESRG